LGTSTVPKDHGESTLTGPGPIAYSPSGRLAILDAHKGRAIWADDGRPVADFSTTFLLTDPISVAGFLVNDRGAAYSAGTTIVLGFGSQVAVDLTGWTPGNYSLAPLESSEGIILTTALDGRRLPLVTEDGLAAPNTPSSLHSNQVALNELIDDSIYIASPFLGRIDSDVELFPVPDVSRQTPNAVLIVLVDEKNDLWVVRADEDGTTVSRIPLATLLPAEHPRAWGNTPAYAVHPDLTELSVLICETDTCELQTYDLTRGS
jgi:hypothetical protein